MKVQTFGRVLIEKKSLLLNLETRLDVILVRLYFCSTLFTARQLITHKKIRVNFHVVSIPGFHVRSGDIISIFPHQLDLVKSKLKYPLGERESPYLRLPNAQNGLILSTKNDPASHLEVNYKTFHAILLYEPIQITFPYKIDLDFLF